MKVGTDGVLLGAWANLAQATSILDIGTGTGLLALMAAQRNPATRIDAVEINAEAAREAQENRDESPWSERINIHCCSIFDFTPNCTYDSILCNPPFFIDSTKAPDQDRTTARHCVPLFHVRLLEVVNALLRPEGVFSLILPVTEARQLIPIAIEYGFFVYRITEVAPTPQKPPKRFLLEFGKEKREIVTDQIVVELSRHVYSEAYQNLTRDFYLAF